MLQRQQTGAKVTPIWNALVVELGIDPRAPFIAPEDPPLTKRQRHKAKTRTDRILAGLEGK
jgi:hypothetical protein